MHHLTLVNLCRKEREKVKRKRFFTGLELSERLIITRGGVY